MMTARKEEEEELKKQRKREEEEYNYALQQKRKIDADQYEEKKSRLEKELKDKKESFEQEFKARELAISESENELKELRSKVEEFPAILTKEVDQAVKTATDNLKKEYDYQALLKKKEYESDLKLNSQTIQNLQNRIKDLELQLKQAYTKIDASENNVKDITIKAIESSAASRLTDQQKSSYEPRNQKEN